MIDNVSKIWKDSCQVSNQTHLLSISYQAFAVSCCTFRAKVATRTSLHCVVLIVLKVELRAA
jgi:hypothetical protein